MSDVPTTRTFVGSMVSSGSVELCCPSFVRSNEILGTVEFAVRLKVCRWSEARRVAVSSTRTPLVYGAQKHHPNEGIMPSRDVGENVEECEIGRTRLVEKYPGVAESSGRPVIHLLRPIQYSMLD